MYAYNTYTKTDVKYVFVHLFCKPFSRSTTERARAIQGTGKYLCI